MPARYSKAESPGGQCQAPRGERDFDWDVIARRPAQLYQEILPKPEAAPVERNFG